MKSIKMLLPVILLQLTSQIAPAQEKGQIVRLAKLVIDSAYLESYKAILKEGIETALRVEPGVITLYAVADQGHPTHITILETYASDEAYRFHLQTPHFIKYKNSTLHMVKSLELVNTMPLLPELAVTQKREKSKKVKN